MPLFHSRDAAPFVRLVWWYCATPGQGKDGKAKEGAISGSREAPKLIIRSNVGYLPPDSLLEELCEAGFVLQLFRLHIFIDILKLLRAPVSGFIYSGPCSGGQPSPAPFFWAAVGHDNRRDSHRCTYPKEAPRLRPLQDTSSTTSQNPGDPQSAVSPSSPSSNNAPDHFKYRSAIGKPPAACPTSISHTLLFLSNGVLPIPGFLSTELLDRLTLNLISCDTINRMSAVNNAHNHKHR